MTIFMESKSKNKKIISEAEFSTELMAIMPALRGYVMSLIPEQSASEDVVQETHLFLWEKRENFEIGTSFKSWAYKVAYFKAIAARRDYAREQRRIIFSDEVILKIASQAEEVANQGSERMEQLKRCLIHLKPEERKLLQYKYLDRGSLTKLAEITGKSPNSIHKTISRLRLRLKSCIDKHTLIPDH